MVCSAHGGVALGCASNQVATNKCIDCTCSGNSEIKAVRCPKSRSIKRGKYKLLESLLVGVAAKFAGQRPYGLYANTRQQHKALDTHGKFKKQMLCTCYRDLLVASIKHHTF